MKPLSTITPPLQLLCTDIGRGHPFYLDGIADALERREPSGLTIERHSVFDISHGLARLAWCAVRGAYRLGSGGGVSSWVYSGLRSGRDYTNAGLVGRLLARDLMKFFASRPGPVVVSHPLLVGLMASRTRVIYQHGELVAPRESLVPGAELIIVPTVKVADAFIRAGYRPDKILVSGLCIEPALAAQAELSYERRLRRMAGDGPLTGLFSSSGSEPKQHVAQLISSITSCVESGVRVRVLARAGGRLERELIYDSKIKGLIHRKLRAGDAWPQELGLCGLAGFRSRREENVLAAYLMAEVDFVVCPAHERSNWAMGLGLPAFLLTPAIGPFAPLNQSLLVTAGTAGLVDSGSGPAGLGSAVRGLRASGQLAAMARLGWGSPIDGFARIVAALVERLG